MTNKHTSWIIKGDEVGYKSDADDQSFGMFCPVAIITDMDQIGLIAAAPETAAERDRLKEINEGLIEALEKIAEVCNGYDLEAGWACKTARAAIAKATGQALQDLADIGQELNI